MGGFSFASVILSYFLAAGGLLTGGLLIGYTKQTNEVVVLALFAVGSFLGGFVAARASRGSTIIEPAIGTIALAATILLVLLGTDAKQLVWHSGEVTGAGKAIAEVVGALVVGALVGAFLSEKILGEATESSIPWIFYAALTGFGATVVGAFIAYVLFAKHGGGSEEKLGTMGLAGIGIGTLLAGLAVGASARTRPLIAALLGGAIGSAGFALLSAKASGQASDSDLPKVIAVFGVLGGVVMLIGALGGWYTFGKRNA
ncbi:MAG: hypothetical protein QM831_02660 [Kofleriaceae bacterium]